jgi:hypothetical protein
MGDRFRLIGWPWRHDLISRKPNLAYGCSKMRLWYCLKHARGDFESHARQICRHLVSNISRIQKYKILTFRYKFYYKFWLRNVLITIKPYLKLLTLRIHRKRCQMSSLCPSRGNLFGIELRTGRHTICQEKYIFLLQVF